MCASVDVGEHTRRFGMLWTRCATQTIRFPKRILMSSRWCIPCCCRVYPCRHATPERWSSHVPAWSRTGPRRQCAPQCGLWVFQVRRVREDACRHRGELQHQHDMTVLKQPGGSPEVPTLDVGTLVGIYESTYIQCRYFCRYFLLVL